VVLATWLNGKGEFERELATIPLEKALRTRELFLQHVDALAALGRWEEIKGLLESERFPLDQVVQQMYLARCSAQLGEKAATANHWHAALEAASGDAQKLMALADYAEKNGSTETAEAAFHLAARQVPGLRPAQQGRLRLAQTRGDLRTMHAILAEMRALWPNESAIENDEAYTHLLLMGDRAGGTGAVPSASPDLAQIEQAAADLVKREPSSLPHRTLLALARLRQNHPAEALRAYDQITVAAHALTPGALAVHAAVLAANGHDADARTEAAHIPLDALLPEERALVASLAP
jgi:tetratricopeptide (TPR) repeat protein